MKSLSEMRLEQENFHLKRRILELSRMLNLSSPDIFNPNDIKRVDLDGPIPHDFKAVVNCDYSADPFGGWEINVTGYPNRALWRWQYQYRVTEPELIGKDILPDLLSREHEKFQRALLSHVFGRSKMGA